MRTLFLTTTDGRLVRPRTQEPRPCPYFVVAAARNGLVWSISKDLDDKVAARLHELFDGEPLLGDPGLDWKPTVVDELRDALGHRDPPPRIETGPSYVLDSQPGPVTALDGFRMMTSDSGDVASVELDPSWNLVPPWAIAVAGDRAIGVCHTSRSGIYAVEPGVETVEAFRGRGVGSAVVRAWSRLVTDRTVFYSTTHDNVASQRIAIGLGYRPIAHWFRLQSG